VKAMTTQRMTVRKCESSLPSLFDLVINDKAAKALGITILPSMLINAEVVL